MSGFSFPYTNVREDGTNIGIQPNLNFLTPAGGPYVVQDTTNNEIDVDLTTMITTGGGWTRDAGPPATVRLTTAADQTAIGTAIPTVGRKLTILTTGADQGIRVTTTAAADNVLDVLLGGEANRRLTIDSAGLIQWGPGGAGALDTSLGRGAASRIEAGSGDAIDVIAGGRLEHRTLTGDANPTVQAGASAVLLGAGGGTVLDVRLDRSAVATLRLDDNALGALTVVGGADDVLTIGTAAARLAAANATILRVYAAAGAANPTVQISDTSIVLGPGAGTAPDVSITRGATDRAELGDGDSLGTLGTGAVSNRAATLDANPRMNLISDRLFFGAGAGDVVDTGWRRSAAATLEWTGTLVPAATGQDIGTDALRFDIFSREVWGGQVTDVTAGMSPYTVTAGDYELHCDTSGGAITILLPTVASSRKRRIQIMKVTTDANAVTITPNGADTVLTVAGSAATLAGGAVRSLGLTGSIGASVDWRGW
jgi:hypothetical protein